ncbi:MAG: metallophosphoesterase [Gammaproteobacteria bacterium]|nr:metallophosphoesterase [Gammaproteobacteria bacterium]
MGKKFTTIFPCYQGEEWTGTLLPTVSENWLVGKKRSVSKDRYHREAYTKELKKVIGEKAWKWPRRPLFFISDMHGDADAFIASLVASGAIKKTGPKDKDLKITDACLKGKILIGGDCFDKGPSTLRLLRVIKILLRKHADVLILAGNHDIRMMLGISSIDLEDDPRTDHFFIRMGRKMVPFLKEISEEYLQDKDALRDVPSARECRRILYPPKSWFRDFPLQAVWNMPDATIAKEVSKLRDKIHQFDEDCKKADLSIRMVYAAAKKWAELFLQPKGEFAWFYRHMSLCYRKGSLLFLHAGIDDRIAGILNHSDWKHLNKQFRQLMLGNPFEFYYGPFANIMRTKYRDVDMPLTRTGVKKLHQQGIRAVVHGHRNLLHGQRLMLRKGLLNVECDTTLDRNSRKKEGLKGVGAAVTVIHPEGYILGISNDYPFIKLFDPKHIVRRTRSLSDLG